MGAVGGGGRGGGAVSPDAGPEADEGEPLALLLAAPAQPAPPRVRQPHAPSIQRPSHVPLLAETLGHLQRAAFLLL